MFCQSCGAEAPTKHVAFYQNIGALVMRFTSTIKGDLCKSCIHRHFWKFTLVNVTLGWWGLHSLIITPFFLLNADFRRGKRTHIFDHGEAVFPVFLRGSCELVFSGIEAAGLRSD